MIFSLIVGTNLVGDSYLEQLEQSGYESYLSDPQTGKIRQGAFLIYAPDAAQGFPLSAGADGQIFTVDDPAVALPAGYTIATVRADGAVSFDRSREGRIDTIEPAAAASPDFAKQGLLQSYNSLLDVLKQRYSYTELRKLDWEQIRQTYLPRVQQADAANDMAAYYSALNDLALSIGDAHVQVSGPQAFMNAPIIAAFTANPADLGAGLAELSDGRFIVTAVRPDSPAAQAGWQFGTEIVTIDGQSVSARRDSLPLLSSKSTDETRNASKLSRILLFPDGANVTVEFHQPGSPDLQTATLTALVPASDAPSTPSGEQAPQEISFKDLDGGYGYIQWKAFDDPIYKLAVWEKFLTKYHSAPGIVIDLRDNGGGNLQLFYTMASYLFTADKPARLHWLDEYSYDDKQNDLVRAFAADLPLSAPNPDLAYTGAVVVLVNEESASAAEYMPQFLQRLGRAVVIGEHSTEGAGGQIERAALPGGITFQFTKGRTYFAGTRDLNLEGKGVTLDVRVPINEENERAKLDGRDSVLEAGVKTLGDAASKAAVAKLTARPWQWSKSYNSAADQPPVDSPEKYTVSFGNDGAVTVRADCNQASGAYTLGEEGALTIALGPATAAACGAGSRGEEFLRLLGATQSYSSLGDQIVIVLTPGSSPLGLILDQVN